MRKLVLSAAAVLIMSTAAYASSTQDAQKICVERYNTEKSGGTIPVGMSRSKYLNQCVGSIRRAAKLEQDLADGTAGTDDVGVNEVATTATSGKPAGTIAKPARIKTTLTLAPRGS